MKDEERDEEPQEGEASTPQEEAPTSMEQLQAELEEADRERSQFRSLAQRVQADFINYRRRVEEERQELQREANTRLLLDLLPIMDDFQRALEHAQSQDDHPAWLEGMALIYRKLQAVLEGEGVSVIQVTGQDFDPWEHEALLYQESPDHREGEVLSVIRDGYKLHGKVLRPAQVVVAKGAGHQETPQQEELDSTSEEKEG